MRADRVVDVEVAVDVRGEVLAVGDVVAVEVLVGDRAEEPLDLSVGLGALDAGADVAQLWARADVAGELGGLEAGAVIGG